MGRPSWTQSGAVFGTVGPAALSRDHSRPDRADQVVAGRQRLMRVLLRRCLGVSRPEGVGQESLWQCPGEPSRGPCRSACSALKGHNRFCAALSGPSQCTVAHQIAPDAALRIPGGSPNFSSPHPTPSRLTAHCWTNQVRVVGSFLKNWSICWPTLIWPVGDSCI